MFPLPLGSYTCSSSEDLRAWTPRMGDVPMEVSLRRSNWPLQYAQEPEGSRWMAILDTGNSHIPDLAFMLLFACCSSLLLEPSACSKVVLYITELSCLCLGNKGFHCVHSWGDESWETDYEVLRKLFYKEHVQSQMVDWDGTGQEGWTCGKAQVPQGFSEIPGVRNLQVFLNSRVRDRQIMIWHWRKLWPIIGWLTRTFTLHCSFWMLYLNNPIL